MVIFGKLLGIFLGMAKPRHYKVSNMNSEKSSIDKKYMPFLFSAIQKIRDEGWDEKFKNINEYYVSIEEHIHIIEGKQCVLISFFSELITQDNWMDIGSDGIDIKGVSFYIEIKTKEVIFTHRF